MGRTKKSGAANPAPRIDWLLHDEEEPVATFIPEVLADVEVRTSVGVEPHVKLRLVFKDGVSETFTVPLPTIGSVDWFGKDKRCLINPHYSKANQYIANIIRAGLVDVKSEKLFLLDCLGIHHVDNTVVFCAGDRVIAQPSDEEQVTDYELVPLSFRLDIDPNLTPKEAFAGMRELIVLSPEIGRVLVAHAISGITRAAFKAAGFTPCAVLAIIGGTGMLKSHYVPHITQLYNRGDEIGKDTRFNSTKRFIEDVLFEFSECTAVVDDLHTAASGGIRRTNEETAEEIIRRIGDDTGRGHKEGYTSVQKKFRGNAVFIGEYTIGRESTVPRALVANLTMPPNGEILDKYQRHQPLLVSTFYYFFIEWYVRNYGDIRDEIDARLTKFRKTVVTGTHLRLRDTQFYLLTAFMLFLAFCEDSGFITAEEAREEYSSFGSQLVELVQAQQDRISQDEKKPEVLDYLKLIRKLFKSNSFRLADSVEQFDRDKHDGLIHYECLCLRSDRLEKRIRKIFRGVQIKDIVNALLAKGALKLVDKKNSVQISALRGLRFYSIWLHLMD